MIDDHSALEVLKQERLAFGLPADEIAEDWNNQLTKKPENYDGQNAVILVHGFIGSPFFMRELAMIYLKKGFMVHILRLPGHGVCPKALENIQLEDWISTVSNAITALSKETKHVHLAGFSLGALLSCLADHPIKSYLLIAPPFGISPMSLLARSLNAIGFHRLYVLTRLSTPCKKCCSVMYDQFPVSIVTVMAEAIKRFNESPNQLNDKKIMMIMSLDDTVVDNDKLLDFFAQNTNPESQLRIYMSNVKEMNDERITTVDSLSFGKNIKGISHIAYPYSPENPYFGKDGIYYGKLPDNTIFGESSFLSGLNKNFKRLSYNPDFAEMTEQLKQFLLNEST